MQLHLLSCRLRCYTFRLYVVVLTMVVLFALCNKKRSRSIEVANPTSISYKRLARHEYILNFYISHYTISMEKWLIPLLLKL